VLNPDHMGFHTDPSNGFLNVLFLGKSLIKIMHYAKHGGELYHINA
jgi:hypothetical protein